MESLSNYLSSLKESDLFWRLHILKLVRRTICDLGKGKSDRRESKISGHPLKLSAKDINEGRNILTTSIGISENLA